jgi:predicted metal-dependent HD superfamily phosphohydrolase
MVDQCLARAAAGFLAKEKLYHTAFFRDGLERVARENLGRLVDELTSRLARA